MKKVVSVLLSFLVFFIAFFVQIVVSSVGVILYMIIKGAKIYSDTSLGTEEMENRILETAENILQDGTFLGIVTLLATAATLVIGGICYYFFFVRKKKQTMKLTKIIDGKCFIQLLILGIGMQLFISGILNIVLSMSSYLSDNYNAITETISTNTIFMIISVTILAPFAEEIIYRGIVLKVCENSMPFIAANMIQALLFGLYHMNLVQGTYAFAMGLIFGYVCKKRKSIIASIFLHMVVNISSYLMAVIEKIPVSEIVLLVGAIVIGGIFMLLSLLTLKEPEVNLEEVKEAVL